MTYAEPKFKIGDTVLYSGSNPQVSHDPIKIAARYNRGETGWRYKVPKTKGDFTWVMEHYLRLPEARPAPPPGWALNKLNPVAPDPEIRVMQAIAESAQAQEAAFKARQAMVDAVYAQQEAEERKALEDAEKARVAAMRERIGYELLLAAATSLLLQAIARDTEGYEPELKKELAKFRHELQPLAETYGYAIVPVGDGSRATISMI